MTDDEAATDFVVAAAINASPKRVHSIAHLVEIEPGLWLGNATAAHDMERMRQRRITHVLTLDSCPLPAHVLQQPDITNKYVQVSDVAKEDLLTHFDECIRFIVDALVMKNNVLVHCYLGNSQSVAVVVAFLMRSHRITFTPALDRVKASSPTASPNAGFVQQLRLFYKMGWKIDAQHEQFKMYRLRLAADKVRKAKILPQSCMDLVKPDPALTQAKPEPHVYRCRKCRRIVAAKGNIITHQRSDAPAANIQNRANADADDDDEAAVVAIVVSEAAAISLSLSGQSSAEEDSNADNRKAEAIGIERTARKRALAATGGEPCAKPATPCREILFVEPMAWMDGVLRDSQGKLHCPKCRTKLGSFSWTMGCRCPCGAQQSPAFYLVPARVELSRSVQNVEVSL